jgi:hypothetical protein
VGSVLKSQKKGGGRKEKGGDLPSVRLFLVRAVVAASGVVVPQLRLRGGGERQAHAGEEDQLLDGHSRTKEKFPTALASLSSFLSFPFFRKVQKGVAVLKTPSFSLLFLPPFSSFCSLFSGERKRAVAFRLFLSPLHILGAGSICDHGGLEGVVPGFRRCARDRPRRARAATCLQLRRLR